MSSIYAELARLKFNTEQKSALLYYLTKNGEAEAQAEKAFTACNNDEEKYAYLNLVLGDCMYLIISVIFFVCLY